MPEVKLSGRPVAYEVIVRRSATRARLRVGPAGVQVVLPPSKPRSFAEAFLAENADWVLHQLDAAERIGGIRMPPPERLKNTVLFRGEPTLVTVERRTAGPAFSTVTAGDRGIVISAPLSYRRDLGPVVEKWLRGQARELIGKQVEAWSKVVKRAPNRVFLRSQRTKWGNCSPLGNVSLNWRLVKAPPRVLEAIVLHEMVHLVEPSHKARFWLILRSHCSDYDQRVRWLKEHEEELFAPILIRE